MSKRFNIGFKGEVADGFAIGDVKDTFGTEFRQRDDVIDRLFSGNPCRLGVDLELDQASSAIDRLRSIGAVVYLLDEDGQIVNESPSASANDAEVAEPARSSDIDTNSHDTPIIESAQPAEVDTASDAADLADEAQPSDADAAGNDAGIVATAQPAKTANVNDDADDSLTATAKLRHLQQITEPKAVETLRPADQRKVRFRYRFDTFMAKGGGSIFKALTATFVVTFLAIGILRGALLLIFPEVAQQHEDLGFFGNLYITFLEITDPGNMAQDIYSSVAYKVFAVLAGIAGIVMLSALIAFITTAMDQKIYELKRGRSKVIEEGHTLILGWNEQRIIETVRELIVANESEKDACVVILADKDKEVLDDVLRLRIRNSGTTRIVTRSGDVSSMTNLDMVSLETCKSVIILASCDDTDNDERKASSDAKAIQTVLATMGNKIDDDEFSVVVEIFNPTHRDIVRSTFPDHVVTVNTSDILAKLLVQTSRSAGLSVVYNEILSFDGCEMYFVDGEWGARTFGDASYHFPDGVPMGIRESQGRIVMNPSPNTVLQPNDQILILANDDSTIDFHEHPIAEPKEFPLSGRRQTQQIESELMIGWTQKSPAIIREFADYITAGSRIDILLKNPANDQVARIEALNDELESIQVGLIQKDCLNIDELLSVKPFEYDNIIILAGNAGEGANVDAARIDSENIVALLLLRRIFSQYPDESRNTKLITEILDSQNDALVAKAGVHDVIISNRLVSMIMAQISESRDIEKIYDDIFQEDGSEIYLKPAHLYFDEFPVEVAFADMMAIAQKRDEVCIGVKIKSLESDQASNNGISLIPEKSKTYSLQKDDSLVVLAEDEL